MSMFPTCSLESDERACHAKYLMLIPHHVHGGGFGGECFHALLVLPSKPSTAEGRCLARAQTEKTNGSIWTRHHFGLLPQAPASRRHRGCWCQSQTRAISLARTSPQRVNGKRSLPSSVLGSSGGRGTVSIHKSPSWLEPDIGLSRTFLYTPSETRTFFYRTHLLVTPKKERKTRSYWSPPIQALLLKVYRRIFFVPLSARSCCHSALR